MDQDTTTIFLTCLSYGNELDKINRLAGISAEQWHAVAKLASRHNVSALLYYHLKLLGIALPADLAETLKQEHRQDALRNARLYQQLARLLRLLHEKDIPVIMLKGAYLAEAVYPDIGLRGMGDVDLLVKKDNLLRSEQELLTLGFTPEEYNRTIGQENHHFSYVLPKNGLRLEIHWKIVDAIYPFQIDVEGLWRRAQPIRMAQALAWRLSPEDLLLHLCLHTARHTLKKMELRMLCDIGEVLRHFGASLDWQDVAARSRQWGSLRATYIVLRSAIELLGVAVPAEQFASLQPDQFEEQYFELARARFLQEDTDTRIAFDGETVRLWGEKGLERKLALIRERLIPSREIMALKYPASANSWRIYLYYPVRIMYVLRNHGATLWRLVRGDKQTQAFAEHSNEVSALYDWLMSG